MDKPSLLLSGLVTSTLRSKFTSISPLTQQSPSPLKPRHCRNISDMTERPQLTKRKAKHRCISCDNEVAFHLKKTKRLQVTAFSKTISPPIWPNVALEVRRPRSDFTFTELLQRQRVLTSPQNAREGRWLDRAKLITPVLVKNPQMQTLRVSGKRTRLAARRLSPQPFKVSPERQTKVRTVLPDISVEGWVA